VAIVSFDLKSAIAGIAPTLASMLGGPLAGTAVTALEGAFGLHAGAGQDGITSVMNMGGMTPEMIANIRAADQKHAEALAQQNIDVLKLNADREAAMTAAEDGDRDSARRREISIKDPTVARLAYTVIGGFLAISLAQLVCLMGWPELAAKIPQSGWLLIGNISGYLAAEARSAAAYYFGTSAGSAAKNETIASMAKE
jgi:hypothetical protein